MQQEYLIHEGHPRLLLFFAGWACDAHPFKQYHPQGMDFMICYDYRTLRFDEELIRGYQSYHIIGWSMGVWAAACILPKLIQAGVLSPGNHTSIAFNGTASPISHSPEEEGIPSELFEGTLQNLTPVSLQKFFRRIRSNSTTYQGFDGDNTPPPIRGSKRRAGMYQATSKRGSTQVFRFRPILLRGGRQDISFQSGTYIDTSLRTLR